MYIASDPSPEAVPRHASGNQRAATVVTALITKGCPMANADLCQAARDISLMGWIPRYRAAAQNGRQYRTMPRPPDAVGVDHPGSGIGR